MRMSRTARLKLSDGIIAACLGSLLLAACNSDPQDQKIVEPLKAVAKDLLDQGDAQKAYIVLGSVKQIDPNSPGLNELLMLAENRRGQIIKVPYSFVNDGLQISFDTIEIAEIMKGWSTTVGHRLGPDARWVVASGTVYEAEGRYRNNLDWRKFVHVRNRAGLDLSPSNIICAQKIMMSSGEVPFHSHARDDFKIGFQLKPDDFPLQLVFADGKISETLEIR